MDDQQVGAIFRAVRHRLGLRQSDVAKLAHVDRAYVSLIERGRLARLPLETSRRVATTLDIGLPLAPRWHGPDLSRLLDSHHAVIVEHVAAQLVRAGWDVLPEYTFNHFGERGSVDLVAWHPTRRALLLIEVKTRLVDIQDLLSTVDRRERIVPGLLQQERGWRVSTLATILVVPSSTTIRRIIAAHRATFRLAFPERTVAVRHWLARPDRPFRGIWLLPEGQPRVSGGRPSRQRIRRPRQPNG